VYYFGAVAGGVWKSINAGQTWVPIFDSQPIASIGALEIAPSDPNIIYVGTGEADIRSDITYGDGVYKSTDAGKTWKHSGLRDTRQIGRLLVDPHNPNVVFVAALGHAYGPNSERGVFRSTDGGETWRKVLYKDENTGAIDLAFQPGNTRVIYAALWSAKRTPWSAYPPIEGPGSGLYKSTDGGKTWNELTGNGLPAGPLGRIGIAVAPSGPRRVYALITAKEGGLFRSDDAGATWTRVSTDSRIRGRSWYFSGITVDPENADVVYIPNVSLYRSMNGGRTFHGIKGAPGGDDYHFLWIAPDDPKRMILASDQGTVVSVDNGKSWSSWYNQPTAQIYHVAVDNQYPYWIYGAQQDSGTVGIASRSDYGQITFRDWHPVGGGESGYIAPDPADKNIIYAGNTYGQLYRYDHRTGQSQDISPWPRGAFGVEISQRKYRFTWTSPLVFSPRNSRELYFGAQYILRTVDQGKTWQEISPDLTGDSRPKGQTPKDTDPPTIENAKARGYGVVYTIAPSPLQAGLIWAGTDTGLIQLTRDDGKTWTNVTPPGLSDWSKIALIDASHFDPGTAYAAIDRHRLDDLTPHIFGTHDYGKTWREIVAGIPDTAYVNAVREDLKRKGLLYAGTETGVYVSLDDGAHWSSLQLNLPVTSVRDLAVHGDDLVAATHGRSFWVLDDLSPLRQISPAVTTSTAFLFQPSATLRTRYNNNRDTPLPVETPVGQNPPDGAVIYYWLQSDVSDVSIDILDSAGQVVRHYTSREEPREADPELAIPNYWLHPPGPLAKTKGMHRLIWDLRYPDPPGAGREYSMAAAIGQNTPSLPQGPLVLPGAFQVKLTVDGATQTKPIEVALDPRIKTPPADLAKQFDLAMRIQKALIEAADAIRKGGSGAAEIRRASAAFYGLAGVVDSADRAPTSQALAAYRDARQALDAALRK
jgi:photosystem II stability/assembly factor-like uncharacterized protein